MSFQFALKIVVYSELLEEKKQYIIARQLLKSGTQLVLILEKLRMRKVKPILFTN
jgi:hypothetical protein